MANIFAEYAQPYKSVLDYSAEMDQADARKSALQQSSLALQQGQMNLDQTRQTMALSTAKNNAIQSIYSQLGPQSSPLDRARAMQQNPLTAADGVAAEKALLDADKTRADTGESIAKGQQAAANAAGQTQDQAMKAHSEHLQKLQGVTTPQQMLDWAREGVNDKAVTMTGAGNIEQTLQQDPTQFAALKQQLLDTGVSIKDKFVQGQETARSAANNATSVSTNAATNATSRANNASTQAGENARASAGRAQALTIAGINPDGSVKEDGGLLNPASVANAAARYNMDGTLPPNLGRGAQGPRQTAMILNEAAGQAAARGDSPEAQRIQQLANKSSAMALNKLSGQEAIVGAAEKNFTANANMVSGLVAKVDNTGVPILNKWINAGKRSVTGDPNISALDANVKATVNEYAKIVGGGTGGGATAQGEISKIEGLLSAAQTPQQVESVLNVMRQETANRMQSFKDQKAELTGSMRPTKAATTAPATASANVVTTPDGVPHTFPNPAAAAAFKKAAGI